MPKPKQFLKPDKKKSKHAAPVPTTADEYLAAGVDFEEAGEKWRGGDATKSTRFFIRAIDCYEEALKKFPTSFDLAYNKARVQYELTQHPRLLEQLPGSLLELLQTALESSRYALILKQDNADVLFNTAQVLTSLVDALTSASTRDTSNIEPLPLLEESLELFQRCLALQEFHYSESQAQAEEAMDTADPSQDSMEIPDSEDGGVSLSSGPPSSAQDAEAQQDERWATIIEPVTNETLLDTLLAQLETLTTLCNLLVNDSGRGLSFIEEYSNPLLTLKLPTYLNGATPDRTIEAGVTRANFICALADANFRSQRTDIATYYRAVESAWQGIDLSSHAEGLVNAAESLVTYNTSLRSNLPSSETAVAESRWKALTAAQETLTSASKLPAVENIAKIYLVRGDVELLRWQLGQGKYSLAIAEKSGSVLLSNAGKYYRGGGAYARTTGEKKELFESQVKNALAKGLAGDAQALKDLVSGGGQIGEILAEAVDDGVVEGAHLSVMGIN